MRSSDGEDEPQNLPDGEWVAWITWNDQGDGQPGKRVWMDQTVHN